MRRAFPAHVRAFDELMRWLIETEHGGVVYQVAQRLKVSSATAAQWASGVIKSPKPETLVRICDAYDLDAKAAFELIYVHRPLAVIRPTTGAAGGRRHRRPPPRPHDDAGPSRGAGRLAPDWWGATGPETTHYVNLDRPEIIEEGAGLLPTAA